MSTVWKVCSMILLSLSWVNVVANILIEPLCHHRRVILYDAARCLDLACSSKNNDSPPPSTRTYKHQWVQHWHLWVCSRTENCCISACSTQLTQSGTHHKSAPTHHKSPLCPFVAAQHLLATSRSCFTIHSKTPQSIIIKDSCH